MQEQNIRDLLYRSFDETLYEAENEQLENALATDASLREEQEDMLLLRAQMAQLKQTADSSFAQRVMKELPAQIDLSTQIRRLWPAVAAACLLTITLGLGSIIYAEGNLDTHALIGVDDDLQPEDVLVLGDY